MEERMTMQEALQLEHVHFTIGRRKKAFSLRDISFSVPRGCVTGLIGENGAGKTTLMRLILNMYVPNGGTIRLFGAAAGRDNTEARDNIGFVIDRNFLPTLHTAKSAGRFLSHVYSNWDKEAYERLLHDFKIPPSKLLIRLSSGTAQKVQIAIALSHRADLLILDEPFNFLDPVAKKRFLELLQEFMKAPDHAVFFFLGIFGVTLFVQDQFTGALVLPISGRQFVTAKLLQIAALLAGGFVVLSAVFWGMLVFSRTAWDVSIFYIPAALFPICCTVFMLFFTLMLLGKPPILVGLWMICCGAPGFVSGFFANWKTTLYKDLVAVLPALQEQRPAGFLIALYLVCAGLIFILYKISIGNFNKLQYNRFFSVERKRYG